VVSLEVDFSEGSHEVELVLEFVGVEVGAVPEVEVFDVLAVVVDVVEGFCGEFVIAWRRLNEENG
jgi:hypothetical protein